MGLRSLNLANYSDPVTVEGGQEYELIVKKAEEKPSKKGEMMMLLVLEIVQHPDAAGIFHNMMYPNDARPENINKIWGNNLKKCVQAFGFSLTDDINPEDFIGQTAYAILGEEENERFGMQNTIKTWIIPTADEL